MAQTSLRIEQKLFALSLKHYDGLKWEPKKDDFYTTSRNDLELYQIVDEDEFYFYTNYCDPNKKTSEPQCWKKDEFLMYFGERRVWCPDVVMNLKPEPDGNRSIALDLIEAKPMK